MAERPECAGIRDLLPEIAAGVADDADREQALAHLEDCPECRHELEEATAVIDGLLTLAPAEDPPDGFAAAIMAGLPARGGAPAGAAGSAGLADPAGTDAARGTRPGPVRTWFLRAAAVAAAVALGAGVTWRLTGEDRNLADAYRQTLAVANGHYFTGRRFTDAGRPTDSRVIAYQGNPSWLFVVVRGGLPAGAYEVHLGTRDGRDRVLGTVGVDGGEGSWGITIPDDVAQIAQIRLAGPAGSPPLTADFA